MRDKPLVLIVDDEPQFREIFSMKLRQEGFRVETADNGKDGIEKAKKIMPDLVLMDVKMPEMDGVEALMKIKEDPETSGLKVAFLTSFGNPDEELLNLNARYSKEMGAVGFIRKTDDLDKFIPKTRSFISTP